MLRRLVPKPTRDVDFGARLQIFFISGVAMVLIIRTQLWLTNYPQLGGGELHIAHLLYGGFFMALAIGLLLVYLNRSIHTPAAILGGAGFGFFIDELGKFITADNDYFFKPAAAIIYLVFVAFFLIIRSLERRRGLTPEEAVASAISLLTSATTGDLHEKDRQRALALLEQAGEETPLIRTARGMLEEVSALPTPEPTRVERYFDAVRERYLALIETRAFNRLICWVIGAWGVIVMIGAFVAVLSLFFDGIDDGELQQLSFINWASLASSTLSAILVIVGIRELLRGDRIGAYRQFERALLVSIFVTSVFAFVESQFGAVFGLSINILLLFTLNRMAAAETAGPATQSP